jgi:nicotinate-nucleotide adenylyltransferase
LRPPGPVAPGLKIGLLGGSFNPAHQGHLHASEIALKRLGLDFVWWLVSPQNPLKPVTGMAPFDRRFGAARALVGNPRILVTDIERSLRTRYTIDTLGALKSRFPGVAFVWLMGSDNLSDFTRWHRWAEIFHTVPIAVIARPGTALAARASPAMARFLRATISAADLAGAKPPAIAILDGPRSFESATAIRAGTRTVP